MIAYFNLKLTKKTLLNGLINNREDVVISFGVLPNAENHNVRHYHNPLNFAVEQLFPLRPLPVRLKQIVGFFGLNQEIAWNKINIITFIINNRGDHQIARRNHVLVPIVNAVFDQNREVQGFKIVGELLLIVGEKLHVLKNDVWVHVHVVF